MLILVLALAIGLGVGLLTNVAVPALLLNYLAVIVLAALDACLGGVRASLEHSFSDRRFVAGLAINVLIAVFIVFLGDSVGLRELYLAVAVAFVIRMLSNLAAIRDLWFARHEWE
jgi:small basic protein